MVNIVVTSNLSCVQSAIKPKQLFFCVAMLSGDMWSSKEDNDEEPDWVKEERNQFSSFRDKNDDGFMDRKEVKNWIIPDDYNHAESEAKHLIHEADKDQVSALPYSCNKMQVRHIEDVKKTVLTLTRKTLLCIQLLSHAIIKLSAELKLLRNWNTFHRMYCE